MPGAVRLQRGVHVDPWVPPEAVSGPRVTDDEGHGDDGPGLGAFDDTASRALRAGLVRQIATLDRPWSDPAWDPRVLEALRRVPRHVFMPGVELRTAYMDAPFPIGHGQTISQPTVVALMTQALGLRGSERVLEIGTGSGYQSAILATLARELYTIEIVPALGDAARARLAALGYRNVEVRVGDGYAGWPEAAPFDRVILTAAPRRMPQVLVDQLGEGGLLVAPVGEWFQELRLLEKRDGQIRERSLGGVRFVPMVHGDGR